MCFPKNKKGRPLTVPVSGKPSSLRVSPTQSKVNHSKKQNASAPARGPTLPSTEGESQPETSAFEKTCIEDKSDLMQVSLYRTKKKESGSNETPLPVVTKPADRDQDSPEVFENNAQVVSLNPVNVTQIFVDSVIPQTNVSKMHTDIVDQNTLESMDPNMEDVIFDRLGTSEEHFPEVPQPRPKANVLQPEDDTVEHTLSERCNRLSEKRTRISTTRNEHRPPSTPDRLPSVFTPPPPSKSEKAFHTGKRAARGPVSTRTATVSRPRPLVDYRSAGRTASNVADALDNTCPSHEPLDRLTQRTQRTHRPPSTEFRALTAIPIDSKDNTYPSREQCESAKKTPSCMKGSTIYTTHMKVKDP